MEYFADDVDEGPRLDLDRATWPECVLVRGQGPGSAALARRLRGPRSHSAYEDLKMFTLSETETKVIMRCASGDVPFYRVLRSADFPEDAVKPELVARDRPGPARHRDAPLRPMRRSRDEQTPTRQGSAKKAQGEF